MKKKIFGFMIGFLTTVTVFAQSPRSFKYQAVVRYISGAVIANQSVSFQVNIIQDTSTGATVFTEVHTGVKTNGFGLVSLDIGKGTVQSGNFNTLDWGKHTYYLGINMDVTGGTNYSPIGISQLLSVPYALYAASSGNPGLNLTGTGSTTITGSYPNININSTKLLAGNGILISNDSIINASPDKTVSLTGTGSTIITGNYPNFSVNGNYQFLKISQDTIYLTNGGFVKMPYIAGTGISITGNSIINTMPNVQHTGDAIGSGTLTVVALQGKNISTVAPASGQVLGWNGSVWSPSVDNNNTYYAGSGLSLTGSTFINISPNVNHTGDATGSGALTVVALQGNSISSSTPSINQALRWNGTAWTATNVSENTYYSGAGLSLSGTTFTNSLPNAQHTGDAIGSGALTVVALQGKNISTTSPLNGQVLGWNGSIWTPAVDNNNTYYAGTGLSLSGSTFINTAPATIGGSGTTNQITFWTGSTSLGSDGNLYWDNTNKRLGLGTTSPGQQLDITGNFRLPATTTTSGIIYSGTNPFIHNYGTNNFFAGTGSGNLTTTGINLTAVGYQALNANTSGIDNTAIGSQALINNTTGRLSTAIGWMALYSNTSAQNNTAVGYASLYSTTTGALNTAIGSGSLTSNIDGNWNATVGYQSLLMNSSGNGNSAIGYWALMSNTTGSYNTGLGYSANVSSGTLSNATVLGYGATATVSNQVMLGNSAVSSLYCMGAYTASTSNAANLYVNSSGQIMRTSASTATGSGTSGYVSFWNGSSSLSGSANFFWDNTNSRLGIGTSLPNQQLEITGNLRLPTSTSTSGIIYSGANTFIHNYGTNNTFIGLNAGNLSMTGTLNVGIGTQTLLNNTTGTWNTANGYQALYTNTTGNFNTATGLQALYSNTSGSLNTAYGSSTLLNNTTGSYNTANGSSTLSNNTTGSYNTGTGSAALFYNTTGNYNTSNGYQSLYLNTSGSRNTASGYMALSSNTTGQENTASGFNTFHNNTTGSQNTATGSWVLFNNSTGNFNTATGYCPLYMNTSGSYNTATSYEALYNNINGWSNTANGRRSLYNNISGNMNTATGDSSLFSLTTGSYNTGIGYYANVNSGNISNATVVGYNALASASNQVMLGNTAISSLYCMGAYTATTTNLGNLYVNSSGQIMRSTTGYYAGTGLSLSGNTFINTAPATIGGAGTTNQVTFWTANNSIGSDANLYWDNTNKSLGIGTSSPNASSAIEINSTTKGFLPPRMNTTQMLALTPVEGLMIYNTDIKLPLFYDGMSWLKMDGSIALYVGLSYQGGIIAYILQSGDPGYISGQTHGIIAAPSDQGTGIQWYNGSYSTTGATATALGTGLANTNTIVASQGAGSYAAMLCHNLSLGGYSDWFLPSKDELYKLYLNKAAIGGFANNTYWSSSEYNTSYAWDFDFRYGISSYYNKNPTYSVRAIRAF